MVAVPSPLTGVVAEILAAEGTGVRAGAPLVVVESMKMELAVVAPAAGTVEGLEVRPGDRVRRHQPLLAVAS